MAGNRDIGPEVIDKIASAVNPASDMSTVLSRAQGEGAGSELEKTLHEKVLFFFEI